MTREARGRDVCEEGTGPTPTARREGQASGTTEAAGKPRACDGSRPESFLFDDPYWDDAFDSYHDPSLRTCCRT